MALIIADRVKETATTTGTGTFTLGGAVTGFRTFNAGIGTGNTTYYCIFLDGTNEFEVGLGTYTAPDQLARDTVLASSNSGSKVNFSQGIKSVFCTQPSSKAAYLDASGNLSITTSNITEGTNLYYTDARFDTRLATKDTADLSEGTNLYYTDARARAAISVSGNAIAYNSSTGVITANFEESPTFTGNVVVSGNLTVTGTTTWLDSTNTQISDKNIVLNYASGDSSANADGAGITIQDAVDASTDASLTWNATDDNFEISHGLDFGDNSKARFGAGNDLQIYHNSFASVISDVGTGDLYIGSDNSLLITDSNLSEVKATFATNGAVSLYYDNSAKLATTSTGIDVTGITATDVFKADGGSFSGSIDTTTDAALVIPQTKAIYSLSSSGQYLRKVFHHDGGNGHFIFGQQGTSLIADMLFYPGSSGNIRFYASGSEDVRINASGLMGIGTSSPSKKLEVVNTNSGSNFAGIQLRNNTTTADSSAELRFVISTDTTSTLNSAFIKALRKAGDNNDLIFGTVGSERMRITNAGNIGVGLTSPQTNLHLHS